jgi:hypothetical protein
MTYMDNVDISLLHDFTGSLQSATGFLAEHEEVEVQFGDRRRNARLDALVETKTPDGGSCVLAIEMKRVAYPRDVRMAISHLMEYRATAPSDTQVELCLVADTISPGSREALRKAGINYFDQSGTLYFRHHTWLVDIERAPIRPARKKDIALFRGAREQVVHALLCHWYRNPDEGYISGGELSLLSQTSTYTVSSTMQALEQLDFVESKGGGPSQRRRLRDPAALLDAWAEEWTRRREVKTRWYTYAPSGHITDRVIEGFVRHARQEWALTGAAAANAIVPRLTNVDRVEVIVQPGEAEELASAMGLSQADKGSNVVMIERTGASFLFLDEHPERPHSRFASPFIQYLDLLNGYGRNKELAEEFRKQALKIGSSK